MSFQANWHATGISFDSSVNAFIKSAQYITNPKNLKKYEASFNKMFKENINANMRRAGIEADNFANVFEFHINSKGFSFVNTEPLITQRYEYGYYEGSKDTNEEYYEEYMIQTSPRYFIRPSIQATLDSIGQVMLEEAQKEYNLLTQIQDEDL